MTARTRLLLVAGLALAAAAFGMPGFSGATYTAGSSNTGTVSAASDWTPPTVSVTSPGTTVSGTTTVTVSASDASGIDSVQLQYAATGSSTWTDLCAPLTTAPYTCAWDISTLTDGGYQLRATATDTAGYSATSAVVMTSVLNNATLSLTSPGNNLRGSVNLSATLSGIGSATITTYRLEYSVAAADSWTTICSNTASATLTCPWSTAALSGQYDVRAYAVVAGKAYTSAATGITVDNAAPTGAVTSPVSGATVYGTVTLTSSAADAHSGVAGVVYQSAPAGTGTWTTACTASASPWSCAFDTTTVTDQTYDLRAVITDRAGNSSTTATVTGITVVNAPPTVSVTAPTAGSYVSGTVTVAANASSAAGVSKVSFQVRTGTAAFAEVCADSTAPYSCSWSTTGTSGSYDLRAVVTDSLSRTATSSTVTVTVDNSTLKAYDVQTTNAGVGGVAGLINAGDKVTFTYSSQVDLSTLLAGWTGTSTAVQARVVDGGTDDTFSVDGVNLGTVSLGGNYVANNKTVLIPSSTMVASTTTVAGATVTVVTITLGTPGTGASVVTGNTTMRWTPSTAAKTLGGTACLATVATESGTADKDF